MDYTQAALKLLCIQLKDARQLAPKTLSLGGILFQRAWLQGVLVSIDADGHFLLDDGTALILLDKINDLNLCQCGIGTYVMVVGGYIISDSEPPMIKVHKMVDLSPFPDREAMWYLEVMEAYKLFYKPLIEEFL